MRGRRRSRERGAASHRVIPEKEDWRGPGPAGRGVTLKVIASVGKLTSETPQLPGGQPCREVRECRREPGCWGCLCSHPQHGCLGPSLCLQPRQPTQQGDLLTQQLTVPGHPQHRKGALDPQIVWQKSRQTRLYTPRLTLGLNFISWFSNCQLMLGYRG